MNPLATHDGWTNAHDIIKNDVTARATKISTEINGSMSKVLVPLKHHLKTESGEGVSLTNSPKANMRILKKVTAEFASQQNRTARSSARSIFRRLVYMRTLNKNRPRNCQAWHTLVTMYADWTNEKLDTEFSPSANYCSPRAHVKGSLRRSEATRKKKKT